MSLAALVATWIVAALHVGFFVLEAVLWTKPTGRRIFGLSAQDAETTRVLAVNQGAYNGLLAVGLVWSTLSGETATTTFLLVYVALVGVVGGVTAKPTILALQTLPALVALGLGALSA